MKQGTRPLPSEDAVAESAKAVVRANADLELVYDPDGQVVGVRSKAGYIQTS